LTTSIVSANTVINPPKSQYENAIITIYVDDDNTDGPWDGSDEHPYKNIQDAINNANDGDAIYTHSGTYSENVEVDKSVTLIGEDKETTIIIADETAMAAIYVDKYDYVKISGLDLSTGK